MRALRFSGFGICIWQEFSRSVGQIILYSFLEDLLEEFLIGGACGVAGDVDEGVALAGFGYGNVRQSEAYTDGLRHLR